jgi:sterol desaturase/sphingolipid hydroxylase (fatty acid hydroxylase superfamily)
VRGFLDSWIDAQAWLFDTIVGPGLYRLGLMAWYEPAFNAVEFVMMGVVQIAAIGLVLRLLERRWQLETPDDARLMNVDRVYTVLNKLGVVPLVVFVAAYPITSEIEQLVRVWGVAPPRLEHLASWLADHALVSFLLYFVLYDCAGYWIHRAQHRFGWWWALHSLHHSQRRVTVWTDDRNHILDDLLVSLMLAIFAQFVGVQPEEYVLILMIGRLVESWSHANVGMSFGRVGSKLLVGPRFHRLHHARPSGGERDIHDQNFGAVLPIWDILCGTANYDGRTRPTGVADAGVDADNGRGWLGQQIAVFGRFLRALSPRFNAQIDAARR